MKNLTKSKNCLNPKCQKEFTPKNNKGVYCGSNCRAAHAYQLKSKNGVNKYQYEDCEKSDRKPISLEYPTDESEILSLPIVTKALKILEARRIAHNEKIQTQIDEVKAQKIPSGRDTAFGKVVWQKEQDAKIAELQKQLL